MAAALERPSLTALGQPGARSRDKLARIPVRVEPAAGAALPKPSWLRARPMSSGAVADMAAVLRDHRCIPSARRRCVRTSANASRSAPRPS